MTESIWSSFSSRATFPTLEENLQVDVAIIGGGMTGISTAYELVKRGFKVAVLEQRRVGMGSSGFNTGNLYPAYYELLKFNNDLMKQIVDSRKEAIHSIEENINKFEIDCDFNKVPWNFYTTIENRKGRIEFAYEASKNAQLSVSQTNLPELKFHVLEGIRVEGAAQFNPLRYVQGLAKAIQSENCFIFENACVTQIDDRKLTLENGKTVNASYIVQATHTPKGLSLLHAELGPYREYGIACKVKDLSILPGVYFGYFSTEEQHSIRVYERNNERFLVVVSEPHKVGHGDSHESLKKLEKFARDHFEVQEVTHRWGGQHYKPADHIPYIGRKTVGSNVFVATGFSTHGLVYGQVAAKLISDLIQNNANSLEDVYKPYRLTPFKSAPLIIKENADNLSCMIKDFISGSEESFASIAPGEGKVIAHDGQKLAAFKDEESGLKICSAVCPHMGCLVRWNQSEKSWDCPCHGSRFDTDGEVLEGPSLKALAQIDELKIQPQHIPKSEDYGKHPL